jgi:hypothetical protein
MQSKKKGAAKAAPEWGISNEQRIEGAACETQSRGLKVSLGIAVSTRL